MNGSGNGQSINRYFDILPTSNISLNATLQFNYFDDELNGLAENSLVLWKSANNSNWTNEGFNLRNATGNYVLKNGINSFSRWTLSEIGNALPVQFSLFNLKCENNSILLNWRTSQELHSKIFNVERSIDGTDWVVVGTVTAAGNSTTEQSYIFIDLNSAPNCFYRIVQYDIDGKKNYSSIQKSTCEIRNKLNVWPNPFKDKIILEYSINFNSKAIIGIFDGKGSLLKKQEVNLLRGNNQINLNVNGLPVGVYQVVFELNNSQEKISTIIIKQ